MAEGSKLGLGITLFESFLEYWQSLFCSKKVPSAAQEGFCNDCGVSSSLFQNPAKFHMTIGTLVLLNEQEIQKAQELLQKCKEEFADAIAGGEPLTVEVASIEYMNDDPAMMDVLYAKVTMKDGSNKYVSSSFSMFICLPLKYETILELGEVM
uniref:Uncharacterized protein n=1 Tax=Sphaerodactylus townsendi TaxID=933632 RepID=A0ACB8F8S0_9SAUR